MIVVFDVDGTLVDSGGVDNHCFDEAFREATGTPLLTEQWMAMQEVTAKAIVHQVFPEADPGALAGKEQAVQAGYLARLHAAGRRDPASFRPVPGALAQLARLRETPGLDVAIATGDWHDTIAYKLKLAGFDLSGIPIATASERYHRSEIIRLAVERTGRDLRDAVYVGDGLWDLRATRQLGIPFIGVGARIAQLLAEGAEHALPDYEGGELTGLLEKIAGRSADA